MQPYRGVCKGAVIRERGAEAAEPGDGDGGHDDRPARHGEHDQTDRGQNVNEDDVAEGQAIAACGFPPWSLPRFGAERRHDLSIHQVPFLCTFWGRATAAESELGVKAG